jgi:hypothetical protein
MGKDLGAKRPASMKRHIDRCDHCRMRLARLEQEWKQLAEMRAHSFISEEELLAKIQSAIRTQIASGMEKDRKIAAVLGVYLGQRAAEAIIKGETSESERRKKIAGAEAALSILLGRRGFAAVETRIDSIMNEQPESQGESSR